MVADDPMLGYRNPGRSAEMRWTCELQLLKWSGSKERRLTYSDQLVAAPVGRGAVLKPTLDNL